MRWKHLFYLVVFAAVLLMSFRAVIRHFDPVTAVEMKMSPGEVTHLMGVPLSISQKDVSTVYTYPKATIYFENGKVISIVTPLPRWSPLAH